MKTEAWTRSTLAAIHRNSVSPAYPLATAMLGRQKRTRTNDCELRRFICYPPRLEQQKCFQASDRKGVMRTIEDSRASKQRTRVGRSELPPSLRTQVPLGEEHRTLSQMLYVGRGLLRPLRPNVGLAGRAKGVPSIPR